MTSASDISSRDQGRLGGRYRLRERIGAGGMGQVFEAEDERLGRVVALKLLEATDPASQARFLREARLLATLSHPHVVAVYDVGMEGDRPFLVMERLHGQNLYQRAQHASDPVRLALQVGIQIGSALRSAHKLGIVHRDLKPENIVCVGDPEGAGVCAKLIDFGIAIMDEPSTRVTAPETILGTPEYLAPERLNTALEATGVRGGSDTYGLGVVLYELLAGRTPFASESVGRTLYRLATETAPPLFGELRHPDDSLRPLCEIIDQMLAREASARPLLADVVSRLAHFEQRYAPPVGDPIAIAVVRPVSELLRPGLEEAVSVEGGVLDGWQDGVLRARFPTVERALSGLRRVVRDELKAVVHVGGFDETSAARGAALPASAATEVALWLSRYAVPGELLLSAGARDELGPAGRGDVRLHGSFEQGSGELLQVFAYRLPTTTPTLAERSVAGALGEPFDEALDAIVALRCACGACVSVPALEAAPGTRLVCPHCSQAVVVDPRAATESAPAAPRVAEAGQCTALRPAAETDDPLLDALASL